MGTFPFSELIMAPEKNVKKKTSRYVKELVLSKYCKKGAVPPNFTSLHSCERNFGFNYQDLTLSEMKEIVWGLRCGQQGYFLPPNVVAAACDRIEDKFIPDTYISAGYLSKCFERRGGEAKGFIRSFQQKYARFGRKKNTAGSPGYFFPPKFLQVNLNTAIIGDRRCVSFLTEKSSGAHHQKALDLDAPPGLPQYIHLHRARGVVEIIHSDAEEVADNDTEKIADGDTEKIADPDTVRIADSDTNVIVDSELCEKDLNSAGGAIMEPAHHGDF